MFKTGVVVESDKESTYIVTCDSEFYNLVTKDRKTPQIGEIYTGEIYTPGKYFYKLIFFAMGISLITFMIFNILSNNTPVYSVVIDINSSIQFKVDKFNKILKVQPLNNRGADLVKDLELDDKTLDIALTMLLEKAEKLKYLEEFHLKKDTSVGVYMTNHKNALPSLTSFKNKAKQLKITVQINDNGK